jgi:hypothetical protein
MWNLCLTSLFINQILYTALCIPNYILFSTLMRSSAFWHHLQGAQSNCNFFATHQRFISTYEPSTIRLQLLFTAEQLWISLKFLHCCVFVMKQSKVKTTDAQLMLEMRHIRVNAVASILIISFVYLWRSHRPTLGALPRIQNISCRSSFFLFFFIFFFRFMVPCILDNRFYSPTR